MHETDLYEQLAQYLHLKYPNVPYHFDLAGVNNPSRYSRSLYGRLNRRAWPDLYIARPMPYPGLEDPAKWYSGLFLELKKEGTRLRKRDGSWSSDHIAEQAAVLDELQAAGYIAQFAVGYDEAVQLIESYLGDEPASADTEEIF